MASDKSDLESHGIERLIRRAATDAEFKDWFLGDPVGVAETQPIPITDTELEVLDSTPRSALEAAIDQIANDPARLHQPVPETRAQPRINCGGILPERPAPPPGPPPSADSWLPDDVAGLDRAQIHTELVELAASVARAPVPDDPFIRSHIGPSISAVDAHFSRDVEQLMSAPLDSYSALERHVRELESWVELAAPGGEAGVTERVEATRRALLLLTRLVVLAG